MHPHHRALQLQRRQRHQVPVAGGPQGRCGPSRRPEEGRVVRPPGDPPAHSYRGTDQYRCAHCGEYWEHRNHAAEHRRVIQYEPMTDIYVGIDPGSKNCALVAWSPTRGLITTWKPIGTMPTGVLRLQRLQREIYEELKKLDRDGTIKCIAMEAYSMAEKFGQHASGEIGATIKLTILMHFGASDARSFPVLVAPQQLKKFAAG